MNTIFLTDEKSAEPVTACLLSLASNYQADSHLTQLRHQLQQNLALDLAIEQLWLSDIIISPDSKPTANCPIYHNQMALLVFRSPIAYHDLHQVTKQLETLAHRQDFEKPIVTLDVDIIAVKVAIESENTGWKVLERRLPLASYEQQGLQQLMENISVKASDLAFLQALFDNSLVRITHPT